MKRKELFITIVFMMIATSVFAYDWKSNGFTETGNGVNGEENYLMLKDSNSVSVKVRFQGELDKSWGDRIVELNKKFNEWKYMKPDHVEYFINGDSLEVLVIPSTFKYKETDFLPYIPAGMTFIFDYALRYNFRVTKNDIFLRLNDKFINEELLCKRIKEALDDPIAYLQKREPEYFLLKLNELEESIAAVKNSHDKLTQSVLYFQNSGFLGFGNTPIKSSVIKRVIELKAADPAITKEKIVNVFEKEKVEVKDKEIELILNVFYNEFK